MSTCLRFKKNCIRTAPETLCSWTFLLCRILPLVSLWWCALSHSFSFSDSVLPVPSTLRVQIRNEDFIYAKWNKSLANWISVFSSTHSDVTALLFSSYATFNSILDDPETYGFDPQDKHKPSGTIWHDKTHPTSKVHDLIAKDMATFLYVVAGQIG